jgi:AmmeMemoRadiSam system protein B
MRLRRIYSCLSLVFLVTIVGPETVCARCEVDCVNPFPSLYRDDEVFSSAIARAEQLSLRSRKLSGITVPHHLLAADLIARTLRMVDPERIDKVVILFPDHFKKTRLPFATTRRDFQTVFGTVGTRRADVMLLLGSPDLVEESGLFAKDHGVGAILPFVRHYLPNVDIVPIAVSIKSRRAEWDRLAEHLASIVGPSTLIIQSTDFSHYLPADQAIRRDQEVLNVLAAGDLDAAAGFRQPQHIDSSGAQYLQIKLQRELFHAEPVVLFNTNSQAYSDEPEERTTSYIVQVFDPAPSQMVGINLEGSEVYCFAGDTFFGRSMGRALANLDVAARISDEIKSILNNCRLILNLEGVVVPQVSKNLGATTLAMPTQLTVDWLRALNVVAVSVANNHAMDLGLKAFDRMARMLGDAGLIVLRRGMVADLGAFRLIALTDIDNSSGLRSGVVTDGDLEKLKGSGARGPIVAFMHWGTEYVASPGDRERTLADALNRAGISLIVGAHPHVASRGLELLAGGQAISAYSLGNLLFDQSSRRASGSVLEVRVFDQGTFFARLVAVPNFFDHARQPVLRD